MSTRTQSPSDPQRYRYNPDATSEIMHGQPGFVPANGLATATNVALVVYFLGALLGLMAKFAALNEETSIQTYAATWGVMVLLGAFELPVIVLFLAWLHRVTNNIPALGIQGARHSSGWAVGWWFVPFASLWMPYQVVRQAIRASAPSIVGADRFAWHKIAPPAVLGIWWALFILSSRVGNLYYVFLTLWFAPIEGSPRPAEFDMAFYVIDVLAGICAIVAAVLAIRLVSKVTRDQEEKHMRLRNMRPAQRS